MIRFLKNIHLGLCALICLAADFALIAISYSDMVNVQRHPHIACLNLLFPIALVVVLITLAYTLLFTRKLCWIPLAGLLVCYPTIHRYIPFNSPKGIPENGVLKVLTYNVMAFDMKELKDKGDDNDILKYILDSGADIVCLQECRAEGKATKKFDQRMASVYPYIRKEHIEGGLDYLAILSKYPILHSERISYKSRANGSMAASIKVGEDTLLIINNHFESNRLTTSDKDKYQNIVTNPEKEKLKGDGQMILTKLAKAVRIRERQAKAVLDYMENSGKKNVIMLGDFNDTPTSCISRMMASHLTDAYASSGKGLGFSYHEKFLYFRIDQIFCSKNLSPLSTWTDKSISFSDHYPIISILKLPEKPSNP